MRKLEPIAIQPLAKTTFGNLSFCAAPVAQPSRLRVQAASRRITNTLSLQLIPFAFASVFGVLWPTFSWS